MGWMSLSGCVGITTLSTDANDHVVQIARISAHYIDPKAEMSEDNLRLQYDSMMVAKAAIIRIGKAPPDDDSLKAMFDNSLPIAYQATRQLVRMSNHGTFLDHYNDRTPLINKQFERSLCETMHFQGTH